MDDKGDVDDDDRDEGESGGRGGDNDDGDEDESGGSRGGTGAFRLRLSHRAGTPPFFSRHQVSQTLAVIHYLPSVSNNIIPRCTKSLLKSYCLIPLCTIIELFLMGILVLCTNATKSCSE